MQLLLLLQSTKKMQRRRRRYSSAAKPQKKEYRALGSGEQQAQVHKSEAESLIKAEMKRKWQLDWDMERKGRGLFNNMPKVGSVKGGGWNRMEERVMIRLRTGHTALNGSLFVLGKHATDNCEHCVGRKSQLTMEVCDREGCAERCCERDL